MKHHRTLAPESEDANETATIKYLLVPLLFITTFVSTAVLVAHLAQWATSISFVHYVGAHRGSVATVVQILSHLLGMVHVYTLCETINLSSRAFLTSKSASLDMLKAFNSLYNARTSWSLPWIFQIPILVFVVVTLLPGALWAGAITPVEIFVTSVQSISTPILSNLTGFENHNLYNSVDTPMGTFNYRPELPPIQGQLISSLSEASFKVNNQTVLARLDKTGYSYLGRSYGAGTAVGLSDQNLGADIVNYTYIERGLSAQTRCVVNPSLDIKFEVPWNMPSGWDIEVYNVVGALPNANASNGIYYAIVGYNGLQPLLAAPTLASQGTYFTGFAVLGNKTNYFTPLNMTQCQTFFTVEDYLMFVNVLNRTIMTTPIGKAPNQTLSDENVAFLKFIYDSIYLLQIDSSSLAAPAYGAALINNMGNVNSQENSTSIGTNLTAIANAFDSLIDNYLILGLSAQLMILNDTVPVEVDALYPAMAFGSATYIYAIFAINVIVCAIYAFEAVRTRGWLGIPKFDFMDPKDLVIGASAGGRAIAQAVAAKHRSRESTWHAAADDRVAGRVRFRLDTRLLRIVLDQDDDRDRLLPSQIDPGSPKLGSSSHEMVDMDRHSYHDDPEPFPLGRSTDRILPLDLGGELRLTPAWYSGQQ